MEAGRVGEGQENLSKKGRRGDAEPPPVGGRSGYRLTEEKTQKGLTRSGPLMEAATVMERRRVVKHRSITVAAQKLYLKFLAHLNPMFGPRSIGRTQLRYAHVRYFSTSAHEPPRTTRYMPLSGPFGFVCGAFS